MAVQVTIAWPGRRPRKDALIANEIALSVQQALIERGVVASITVELEEGAKVKETW